MVKPTKTRVASTPVIAQSAPEVSTPVAAYMGVSHRKVVPNRNNDTPPTLRTLNVAASVRLDP